MLQKRIDSSPKNIDLTNDEQSGKIIEIVELILEKYSSSEIAKIEKTIN